MIKILLKSILISTTLLVLSGCAQMNSNFDCPMKNGIRCQSLDEVNAAVDQGEFASTNNESKIESHSYINTSRNEFKDGQSSKLLAVRNQEDVMRVWIAPFEDTSGNYHQASNVYAVVKPGHWIDSPVKELIGEDNV